jgi:hemerythrin-like domain-containing protein
MDVYEVLKQDHKEVKEMMEKIVNGPAEEREKVYVDLEKELMLHNRTEEKYFYLPLKEKLGDIGIIAENGAQEHHLVLKLLNRLEELDTVSDEWLTLFKIVKTSLEAHIEKEENDMFSIAKEQFNDSQAKEMASQIEKEKDILKKEIKQLAEV